MTTEALLRALAAAAAFIAGRRAGRAGVAAAGALAGFAVFGVAARAFPEPLAAGVLLAALTAIFGVIFSASWSPITGEAVVLTALLAIPTSLVSLLALRGQSAGLALAGAFGVLLGISLFAALGTLASAESGWRKPVLWAASIALPALLAFGLDALLAGSRVTKRPAIAAGAALAAAVVWLPVILVERARVKTELREEVLLGLLPEEDALVLRLPWTRALEKRFGRSDERREYVRSALLLAVARQQQRRRSGDAERLRQLEVITFRTRIRRTLDARASRYARSESAEMATPAAES